VQLDQEVGSRYIGKRSIGHLSGGCRIANPVQSVGEPAGQQVVRGNAGGYAAYGPAQQRDRGKGGLADQLLASAG
jgi:hypothetical protein